MAGIANQAVVSDKSNVDAGQKSASRTTLLISSKPVSGPRGRSAEGFPDYFRIAASLDRKRRGADFWAQRGSRSEAFSMRRLGGSRWRLRRTRGTRLAMEFEWAFFRFLFGVKR